MNRQFVGLCLGLAALVATSCSQDPQKLKREYVASGDKFFAEKNYAEAIVQYRNAVVRDSTFGEARFKLGNAYAESGDLRNALREYVRAADLMPKDLQAQLRAGNGLLAAGQYPEAKERALAALNLDSKNVTALVLLGNALAGMKDLDGAITQIEDAIDSDPRRSLTYANLGELEMARGNRAAAESAFKRAVEVNPQAESAHLALANYYWAASRRSEAEAELKKALDLNPKSLSANRALAVFYGLAGQQSETEHFLKTYADLSTDDGPKLILADFYLVRNDVPHAMSVLQPMLGTKTGFTPAKLRIAAVDFSSGKVSEAYQGIEEVLKRDQKNEAALIEKGRFLMVQRKPNDVVPLANAVVARNPQSVAGHYLRGVALAATGQTDDAVKSFQEVLRLRPNADAPLIELARLNLVRGDAPAAVEFLNQAIKHQPRLAIAHFLLARALLQLGKLTLAEPELTLLAKSSPTSTDVQTMLGDYYAQKQETARAIESYTRALDLQPGSLPALNGLLRQEVARHNVAAARQRVELELSKAPTNDGLLVLAGNTYVVAGDLQKAESAFRRALESNPSNIEAYSRLAVIYGSQNRLDDARKEFEELSVRQPKTAVAAATMVGTILTLQNKTEEARKQYERALALDPQMPVAANNLAWDYAETGQNLDVALALAQSAKSKLPNSASVSDTLGWIYYKKGLGGLAVASLEDAARQAPSDPSIRYRLGLAYLKTGDQKRARSSFEQALKMNSQFKEAADAKRALSTMRG